jgi:hypothetical protein
MKNHPLQPIIEKVEHILSDAETDIPQRGSYVVGATMMRDDYFDLIEKYPELEWLAEAGADTETHRVDDPLIEYDLNHMKHLASEIKQKYL